MADTIVIWTDPWIHCVERGVDVVVLYVMNVFDEDNGRQCRELAEVIDWMVSMSH